MSRCFPYPPPGYVRNPVAAAEAESTAKLQKEREKAEKKKEKRSDKKALQQGETSKHSKRSHKKRKHEDVSTAGQESKSKESVEQLEKSGLSEEHGAPCFIQTVRDSPESSQDSSKRRKVVLPSPSQGNILRIKIKSNQDSTGALMEKPRVLEQPLVQQPGSGSSLLSKQGSMQQCSKANVQSLASAPQRVNGVTQAVQKRVITDTQAKIVPRVPPQPALKAAKQVNSQLSVKGPVRRADIAPPKVLENVEPSPVRAIGRVDPPPAKLMQKIQHPPVKELQKIDAQLPAEDIQRKGHAVQKVTRPAVQPPPPVQPTLLQKPKDCPVIKQHQEPLASLSKEEPCTSGRNAGVAPMHEEKQSKSDRKKSRKAEKEKKFRDLFVTWIPPSFEMECTDVGEQDWLLGSTRNSDASTVSCRASDGSVPFQSMVQQPSLQPRATFLPDLHVYQLPYVAPF